jgi:hypothetical protein
MLRYAVHLTDIGGQVYWMTPTINGVRRTTQDQRACDLFRSHADAASAYTELQVVIRAVMASHEIVRVGTR